MWMSGLAWNRPAYRLRQANLRYPHVWPSIAQDLPARRFIRRIRDRISGIFTRGCLYCYLLRGRFRAGRHHAGSLAFHLAEVPEARVRRRYRPLHLYRPVPAIFPASQGFIHLGMPMADFREALRNCEDGKVRRICNRPLLPNKEESKREHLGADALNRQSMSSRSFRVLVVVKEDTMTLFLPPLRTGQCWGAALDRSR